MAKTQENQAFISETSPITMQHDNSDEVTGSCGCFRLFCFGKRTETDRRKLLQQSGESSSWLVKKLKELKEYSEVVAGPKWKNFIRKFSKKPYYYNNNNNNTVFQYDPQSYALNFNDEDDCFLGRNFSTRFAPPSSFGVTDHQSHRPSNL